MEFARQLIEIWDRFERVIDSSAHSTQHICTQHKSDWRYCVINDFFRGFLFLFFFFFSLFLVFAISRLRSHTVNIIVLQNSQWQRGNWTTTKKSDMHTHAIVYSDMNLIVDPICPYYYFYYYHRRIVVKIGLPKRCYRFALIRTFHRATKIQYSFPYKCRWQLHS